MIFVQAFLICGVVCGISQFLLMNTKIGFMGMFTLLMVIGTMLGVMGVFGSLVDFGMMGTIVLIAALCEQFFESFLSVFNGDFASLISFVELLGLIVIFCSIFAVMAKLSLEKQEERKAE